MFLLLLAVLAASSPMVQIDRAADAQLPCEAHAALAQRLESLEQPQPQQTDSKTRAAAPGAGAGLVAKLSFRDGVWELTLQRGAEKPLLRRELKLGPQECALVAESAALVIDRYLAALRAPPEKKKTSSVNPVTQTLHSPSRSAADASEEGNARRDLSRADRKAAAKTAPPVPAKQKEESVAISTIATQTRSASAREPPAPVPDHPAAAANIEPKDALPPPVVSAPLPPIPNLPRPRRVEDLPVHPTAAPEGTPLGQSQTEVIVTTPPEANGASGPAPSANASVPEPAATTTTTVETPAPAPLDVAVPTSPQTGARAVDQLAANAPVAPASIFSIALGPAALVGLPSDLRAAGWLELELPIARFSLRLFAIGTASSAQAVPLAGSPDGRINAQSFLLALSAGPCATLWLRACASGFAGARATLGSSSGSQIFQQTSALLFQPELGLALSFDHRLLGNFELRLDLLVGATLGSASFAIVGGPGRNLSTFDVAGALLFGYRFF